MINTRWRPLRDFLWFCISFYLIKKKNPNPNPNPNPKPKTQNQTQTTLLICNMFYLLWCRDKPNPNPNPKFLKRCPSFIPLQHCKRCSLTITAARWPQQLLVDRNSCSLTATAALTLTAARWNRCSLTSFSCSLTHNSCSLTTTAARWP